MASSNTAVTTYRVQMEGVEGVKKSATDVSASLKGMGRDGAAAAAPMNALSGATNQMSMQSQGLNKNIFTLQSGVAALGQNFGTLSPTLQMAGSRIGGVASAATGLVSVLGLSTGVGLLAGGLLMGVSMLTAHFMDGAKKAEELAKKQRELNAELVNFDKVLANVKKQRTGKEFWSAMYGGTVETTVAMDQVVALQKAGDALIQQGEISKGEALLKKAMVYGRKYNAIIAQNKINERAARTIGLEETVLEGEEDNKTGADTLAKELAKKQDVLDSFKLSDANEKKIAKLNGMISDSDGSSRDAALADFRQLLDSQQKELESAGEDATRFVKENEDAQLLIKKDAERAKQRVVAETNRATMDATVQAGAVMASVGAKAMQDAIKGKKISAAATIEAIGDGLYADGWSNVLKAIPMAILADPRAPILAAAGGVEMAVGAGMGAVGANSSGGSNSQPGGGTSVLSRQSDQYNPQPVAESNTPTIIQLNVLDGNDLVNQINRANSANPSTKFRRGIV
jgi:hypothetical protein